MRENFFTAAPRWWGEPQKKMVGEAIGHPRWDSFVSRLGLIDLPEHTPVGRGGKGHDPRCSRQPDRQEKHPMPRAQKWKCPEDLIALRVRERMRILPVSAAVVTVSILIPTTLDAVVTLARIGAITVIRTATRSGVNHRTTRRRSVNHARRAIRHRWRAVNDRRQATRCGHHDGGREQNRCSKREVHRPTRLRRGGEPSNGNCANQTEDMFCLHTRFDGVFMGFFNGLEK